MHNKEPNVYKELIETFSKDEIDQISQMKRFMEAMSCDSEFRAMVEQNPDDPTIRERMNRVGVKLDNREIQGFWDKKNEKIYSILLRDINEDLSKYPHITEELENYPLMKLWFRWGRERGRMLKNTISGHLNSSAGTTCSDGYFEKYNAWRNRRIVSAKSELGHFGNNIDHPVFAFELNRGCSVNCWFCAFEAEKLTGTFEYTPDNRKLWRDVAEAGVDLFGVMSSNALCYYATEPLDNPDYLSFIRDYHEITGSHVCTATAAPFKDLEAFKGLINYYREDVIPWPRVSVLTASVVRRLHEAFTPDELRDVHLLNQTKDSTREKAISGKTLKIEREDLGGLKKNEDGDDLIPQTSIACVSGFYVNMIDKTIKLISPCRATEDLPLGYRTFGIAEFKDAEDYKETIKKMIDKYMSLNVSSDMNLAFRSDLEMESDKDGFKLNSLYQTHHIKGDPALKILGDIVNEGKSTYGQLYKQLIAAGVSPLTIPGMVKNLFDKGFLDETIF